MEQYDPFIRGRFPVGVRTIRAHDTARDRWFPCEIWYPEDAEDAIGTYPLIVFSHHSGGHRRAATFLCTHLSSHGYVVAALDHSEVVAAELAAKSGESSEQKAARAQAWISNRVPDIRFLLDVLCGSEINFDRSQIGLVGHSFGGWTVLAATEEDPRVRAVVALAPGGSSQTKPGILPLKLSFNWGREVPVLYLVAEDDVSLPLAGMYELFDRTPATKQMVILRRADHLHFLDNVEQEHEKVRAMKFTGELAWISKEMRPIAELCTGEQAHLCVRGLTLCHMDAVLKGQEKARRFLAGDLEAELTVRGVEILVHNA